MIAVCRAADCHTSGHGAHIRLRKLADIDPAADPALRFFEEEPNDRMTSAESFEAAKSVPAALVFHVDRTHRH